MEMSLTARAGGEQSEGQSAVGAEQKVKEPCTAADSLPAGAQLRLWLHYSQRSDESPPLEPLRLPGAWSQRGPEGPPPCEKAQPDTGALNEGKIQIKASLVAVKLRRP
ncbi:hypothetical protein MHYP_G00230760 [Metynnis hypsauchen]